MGVVAYAPSRLPFAFFGDNPGCSFSAFSESAISRSRRFQSRGEQLRAGGRIALLEVAEPPNRVLRWGHGIYFGKVVPRIGGMLSDPTAYRYLPKSVAYLPEPGALLAALQASGFHDATRTLFSGGISQLLLATRDRPDA